MSIGKIEQEEYLRLREGALASLSESGFLKEVSIPESLQEFREKSDWNNKIMNALLTERKSLGGQITALPLFLGTLSIWHLHMAAAFGADNDAAKASITTLCRCMEEVGIVAADRFVEDMIARASDTVFKDENGEEFLRNSDRREAAMESWRRFLELAVERLHGPSDVGARLQDLLSHMNSGFIRLSDQSAKQHAEVIDRLDDLRETLLERLLVQGLPKAEAVELSNTSSPSFAERLKRWAASKSAKDAAEAALWAALDFIPAGTAVKLGIKVVAAMRKATK